ncbi:MAG: hypothetical protein JJU00_16750 [Opitutales bacterium]|nr:hypothetical protein [Opitutales bacterium]
MNIDIRYNPFPRYARAGRSVCSQSGGGGWIDEFGGIRHVVIGPGGTIYFQGTQSAPFAINPYQADKLTPYVRYGDWLVALSVLLSPSANGATPLSPGQRPGNQGNPTIPRAEGARHRSDRAPAPCRGPVDRAEGFRPLGPVTPQPQERGKAKQPPSCQGTPGVDSLLGCPWRPCPFACGTSAFPV